MQSRTSGTRCSRGWPLRKSLAMALVILRGQWAFRAKGAAFAPRAVDRPREGGGRFTPHPGDIARVSGN